MTINSWRTGLAGLCATLILVLFMVVAATAQSKMTTSTPGTPTVKTLNLSGTVVGVEGNQLLVKMDGGSYRLFTPPPDRKFIIDGKEVGLSDLKPGTKLSATLTETTTPITDRTVETLEGTVWFAKGQTVILTLPSGENHQYNVQKDDPVKFYDHNKKEMTVFDLRKGMVISALKLTEAPRVELAQNTVVTGTAPTAEMAQAAPEPAALPHTGSPLPLVGLLGFLFTGASYVLRRLRS